MMEAAIQTWERFQTLFGHDSWVKLVRHSRNRGITAAIRTGIEAASSPWVGPSMRIAPMTRFSCSIWQA